MTDPLPIAGELPVSSHHELTPRRRRPSQHAALSMPPSRSLWRLAGALVLTLGVSLNCHASNETSRHWYSWGSQGEAEREAPTYGLRTSRQHARGDFLVVFVHGLNSTPESVAALLKPAKDAGLACVGFAYPNDQPLDKSASLLAGELRKLSVRDNSQRVALVTHSMGGLIARRVIEDRRLDPGNVSALVMVSPPNHGSRLARFAAAGDLWEHGVARTSGWPWARVADATQDGWGEALQDLSPGSPFLTQLNQQTRNPDVCYTILLGDAGSVSPQRVETIAKGVRRSLETIGAKRTGSRFSRFVKSFPEVVRGQGDGAVALERGRLSGVADTVVLPFGHLDVTAETPSAAASQARHIIKDRLLKHARGGAQRHDAYPGSSS